MSLFKRLYKQNKFLPFFIVNVGLIAIALALSLIALCVLYIWKGSAEMITSLIAKYIMSDFGQVVYFTISKNPYITDFSTMYLPLNFLLMWPFALICKNNEAFFSYDSIPSGNNIYEAERYQKLLNCNVEILSTWEFWFSIILYYAIYFCLIGMVLHRMRKWEKTIDFVFAYSSLICSGLFIVGIIRGTNVFNSLLFILLFIWLYKSPKKWQREISLICFAVAGVCKLYPLLFGVLLLKDKRIFDSIKVVFYFAILTVLPFAIYGGNMFENLFIYVHNLTHFVGGEGRMGNKMNISIFSLVYCIFNLFGASNSVATSIFSWFALIVMFVCCVWITLVSKSKFITMTVIVCGMMIIPPVSYYYVSMFFAIPLLALIDEWGTLSKNRKIFYAVFYSIMAFLPLAATSWYFPQCLLMATIIIWEFIRVLPKGKTTEEIS